MIDLDVLLRCSRCTLKKSTDRFALRPQARTGRASWCKDCCNKHGREHRNKKTLPSKKTVSEYNRSYRIKHPKKTLLHSARNRAKRLGITFSLVESDIVIPAMCPILEIPLTPEGTRWNSPSIDRIDPSLGYVPSNIKIISTKANVMKQDATIEELLKFAENIKQYVKDSNART